MFYTITYKKNTLTKNTFNKILDLKTQKSIPIFLITFFTILKDCTNLLYTHFVRNPYKRKNYMFTANSFSLNKANIKENYFFFCNLKKFHYIYKRTGQNKLRHFNNPLHIKTK